MGQTDMRTPLGRAIGLGSAKFGVGHWRMERLTAIGLLPLTIWLAAALIAHSGDDYNGFVLWMRLPLTSVLMILLLATLFYHTALGLRVVIEDYVHTALKLPLLIAMQFGCLVLAVAGILASLRIAFGA